jgi:hypothetical protein
MERPKTYTSPIHIDPAGIESARQNISVSLIIDSSGSMAWNDPQGLRKSSAKHFIDLLKEKDKAAVVDFDGSAHIWGPLREIQTGDDKTALKNAVNKIDSSGGTNIGAGLQAGYNELLKDYSLNKKAAILLTDGVGSYSNQAQLYKNKGWPVYTIALALTNDHNINLLKNIANETGGKFYNAPNNTYLDEIYQELSQVLGGESPIDSGDATLLSGEAVDRPTLIERGTLQATFHISWADNVVSTAQVNSDYDEFVENGENGLMESEFDVTSAGVQSSLSFTLIRPDGSILNPESPEGDYEYIQGDTYAFYTVDNPRPGIWTLRIEADGAPAQGVKVSIKISGVIETPPTVTIGGIEDGVVLHAPAEIHASASDPDGLRDFVFFLNGEEAWEADLEGETVPTVVSATYYIDPAFMQDGKYKIIAWAADTRGTTWGEGIGFIVDNLPPIADAGPDQEVEVGHEATFDATGSKDAALYILVMDRRFRKFPGRTVCIPIVNKAIIQ